MVKKAERRRLEVVHESLLSNWPRLVRWRSQDAEGAQLRDDLRQAAKRWEEKNRPEGLLWTGTTFKEYELWRERYPGGLSDTEEAFAAAMVEKDGRRRRRARIVRTGAFAILLIVLAIVLVLLRQSEVARARAEAEKLLVLGQLELETYPTATLAYATKSLELADSPSGRLLALRALSAGPPASIVSEGDGSALFNSTGEYLLQMRAGFEPSHQHLKLIFADGSSRLLPATGDTDRLATIWLAPDVFASWSPARGKGLIYQAPDAQLLGEVQLPAGFIAGAWEPERRSLLLQTISGEVWRYQVRSPQGSRLLGSYDALGPDGSRQDAWLNHGADRLSAVVDGQVLVADVLEAGLSTPRVLGRHPDATGIFIGPNGRQLASRDDTGEIRLWDPDRQSDPRLLQGPPGKVSRNPLELEFGFSADGRLMLARPADQGMWIWTLGGGEPHLVARLEGLVDRVVPPAFDSAGKYVAVGSQMAAETLLWQLDTPPATRPLILRRGNVGIHTVSFNAKSDWLATGDQQVVALWPLPSGYSRILGPAAKVRIDPQGRWLIRGSRQAEVSLTPLGPDPSDEVRVLFDDPRFDNLKEVEPSPSGRHLIVSANRIEPNGSQTDDNSDAIFLISTVEGTVRQLPADFDGSLIGLAMSHDERYVAAAWASGDTEVEVIRLWDLETDEIVAVLEPEVLLWANDLAFAPDGRLLWMSERGLQRWDPQTGILELLYAGEGKPTVFRVSNDGRRAVVGLREPTQHAVWVDLETGSVKALDSYGQEIRGLAIDASGRIVATNDKEGAIRVGLADGGEPHLLLGHQGSGATVAIDPKGRWVASSDVNEVRLWPMPDLTKPPLHTLPHEELVRKLHSLTNLRVVADAASSTGWKLDVGPFPGWEEVPEW